jgi:hypothetical protein
MPPRAQGTTTERLVSVICRALYTQRSLLIIDNVDDIEVVWKGGVLHWLRGVGGAGGLGRSQCLVTSRASPYTWRGAHVRCIPLKPAENHLVMEAMLARYASGGGQHTLAPEFQV